MNDEFIFVSTENCQYLQFLSTQKEMREYQITKKLWIFSDPKTEQQPKPQAI
jgi:hypothetical protein